MIKPFYHTNGNYIGFIADNGYLFSRDGNYLGWAENESVYDKNGFYRGRIHEKNGNAYILRNKFGLDPLPKPPLARPAPVISPAPVTNIAPIIPDFGLEDAFHFGLVS